MGKKGKSKKAKDNAEGKASSSEGREAKGQRVRVRVRVRVCGIALPGGERETATEKKREGWGVGGGVQECGSAGEYLCAHMKTNVLSLNV
jgi:hypothetical protein